MKKLKLFLASIVLLALGTAIGGLLFVVTPQEVLSRAEKAVEQGDYVQANQLLAGLPENETTLRLQEECIRLEAKHLLSQGQYEAAQELYRQFGENDYEYLEACYQQAEHLLQENVPRAIVAFAELGTYWDSEERYREACYAYGVQLLAQGYFYSGLQMLEEIKGYRDVDELMEEANYNLALHLYQQEQFLDSQPYFEKVADYKDSSKYIGVVNKIYNYNELLKLAETGRYEDAIALAEKVPENYRDREKILARLEQASQLKIEGSWNSKILNELEQPKYVLQISSKLYGTELQYQCSLFERKLRENKAQQVTGYTGILQEDNTVLLSLKRYSNGLRKYQLRMDEERVLYLEDVIMLEEEEPVANEKAQWQFVKEEQE